KIKESIGQNLPSKTIALYLSGALFAFLFGYLSIKFLLRILKKGRLEYFGYYCIIIGILSWIFLR
ncbi:MAG: undecaprenyl-diphosphate phosphatase, partial [Candidatus Zixiibacteriota bacterium]